jgi:hypothetical protein
MDWLRVLSTRDEHGARRIADNSFGGAADESARGAMARTADDDEVGGEVSGGLNDFNFRRARADDGEGPSAARSCEPFAN